MPNEGHKHFPSKDYYSYKHDMKTESSNKIKHYDGIDDNHTFEIQVNSKTICNYDKIYNTPNTKYNENRKHSSPCSSKSSRARLASIAKSSDKVLNSEKVKSSQLEPINHKDFGDAPNKFNARIMTDLSIYTDPRKNASSEKIVSIRSGPMPKCTLKEVATEDMKNTDIGTAVTVPGLAPHYSQQAEISRCEMNINKFKKNALSKRRQNSSYKMPSEDYSKDYDDSLRVSKKELLSDHVPTPNNENLTSYDFNKHISEDLKKKQDPLLNKIPKKQDLIELVPIRDDRIVTCKTKIEQFENQNATKKPAPSDQSYREKPWIVYLRTLRIPIICPIHRKLFIMMQDALKEKAKNKPNEEQPAPNRGYNSILFNKNNIENSTLQGKDALDPKRKTGFNSITSMKKMMNRNPNCNHNSSQFYNSCLVNVKFEKDNNGLSSIDDKSPKNDLLWINGDQYPDEDEINALASVLYKLFSNPRLGENLNDKKRNKLKTIAGKLIFTLTIFIEIEEYYESIDITLEGKLVNKYSLWTLK